MPPSILEDIHSIAYEKQIDTRYSFPPDIWSYPRANDAKKNIQANHLIEKTKAADSIYHQKRLPYNGYSNNKYISSQSIREEDVLFGRGKKSNNHTGNKYFRELVSRMTPHYRDCSRVQKTALSSSIVNAIHNKGGRFLSPVSCNSNVWVEMTGVALRKKTSQALRDSIAYRRS